MAAGVTSPPLSHDEVLPGLSVQGPSFLPGLDSASAAEASLPWGLVPASREEVAAFLDDLTLHCTPAPPPLEEEGANATGSSASGAASSTDDPSSRGNHGSPEPLRAAYPGRTTLNTLASPEPFEGAVLRMVLDSCDGDLLPIPFVVGEDRSRTWLLSFEEGALRLAHDHRDTRGTPGEANLYGGLAHRTPSEGAEPSSEHLLYFPADASTLEARPARAANTWVMALAPGGDRFYYRLYLNGALRLEAAFDLTRTVPLPPADTASPAGMPPEEAPGDG